MDITNPDAPTLSVPGISSAGSDKTEVVSHPISDASAAAATSPTLSVPVKSTTLLSHNTFIYGLSDKRKTLCYKAMAYGKCNARHAFQKDNKLFPIVGQKMVSESMLLEYGGFVYTTPIAKVVAFVGSWMTNHVPLGGVFVEQLFQKTLAVFAHQMVKNHQTMDEELKAQRLQQIAMIIANMEATENPNMLMDLPAELNEYDGFVHAWRAHSFMLLEHFIRLKFSTPAAKKLVQELLRDLGDRELIIIKIDQHDYIYGSGNTAGQTLSLIFNDVKYFTNNLNKEGKAYNAAGEMIRRAMQDAEFKKETEAAKMVAELAEHAKKFIYTPEFDAYVQKQKDGVNQSRLEAKATEDATFMAEFETLCKADEAAAAEKQAGLKVLEAKVATAKEAVEAIKKNIEAAQVVVALSEAAVAASQAKVDALKAAMKHESKKHETSTVDS